VGEELRDKNAQKRALAAAAVMGKPPPPPSPGMPPPEIPDAEPAATPGG